MRMYGFTSSQKVPSENGVRDNADSVRRERRMTILQEAMKVVAEPLQKCELKEFIVTARLLVGWRGVPLPISYCFGILEEKDMLAV